MDESTSKWWHIMLMIAAIILLSYIVLSAFAPVKFKMNCDIDKINYGLKMPASCWIPGVTAQNCPLPGRINCEIEGEAPLIFIDRLGR
jgi:hypothetical protein